MAIAIASSIALTACTDDEVSPIKPNNGGGAGSLDPLWYQYKTTQVHNQKTQT